MQYTKKPYKIFLASQSPRRKELMSLAQIDFDIIKIDVDEDFPDDLAIENVPEYLAEKKADALQFIKPDEIIITADTVVIIDNKIFGKPADKVDAIDMLTQIQDNIHTVITGVCIKTFDSKHIFSETTYVKFYPLTKDQITFYIDNFKPYDKAGSYAIQEWVGVVGIEKIEGCFYNVMGLPISKLIKEMNNL